MFYLYFEVPTVTSCSSYLDHLKKFICGYDNIDLTLIKVSQLLTWATSFRAALF